jgi:RNA polymerase sigma factor (sigma-70 family)
MDNKQTNELLSLMSEHVEIVDLNIKTNTNNLTTAYTPQTETFAPFLDKQAPLVEGLKRQDPIAIAQLYDAYSAALYGAVLRIVSSKELAEQVIQDTFLKVWHHGASYDASKGRLFTWLLNIARNTAIDMTRTAYFNNRKKTEHIDNLMHSWSEDALNPDTLGLREVVKKMEDKYKELIDLIYFKQYTQQEAADAMGIPVGTVKTRVRHAILQLRKAF